MKSRLSLAVAALAWDVPTVSSSPRAGCHIVVADMDVAGGQQTVRDVEALGRKAVFIETNTTDAAQVQRMVQTAYEAFGGSTSPSTTSAAPREARQCLLRF